MSEDLKHFGVKGMKWGVRRQEVLKSKEKKQATKRATIRDTKGVGNKQYIRESKKLNVTRRKLDKARSKTGSSEDKVLAKDNLKRAKKIKKSAELTTWMDSAEIKKTYGYDLKPRQVEAIRTIEWQTAKGERFVKKIVKGGAAIATPIAINAGLKMVGESGKVNTGTLNKGIDAYNKYAKYFR